MREDPLRSYQFQLLIDGIEAGGIVSAEGLGADVEVIVYREGGARGSVRHLPGLITYRPLTLRYGVSTNAVLWDWFRAIQQQQTDRRNVSVLQMANDGATEALRWNLIGAWPQSFEAGQLNAMASEIAIESLTLVYDRLERD